MRGQVGHGAVLPQLAEGVGMSDEVLWHIGQVLRERLFIRLVGHDLDGAPRETAGIAEDAEAYVAQSVFGELHDFGLGHGLEHLHLAS